MAAAAAEYMVQNPELQRPLAHCSGASQRAVMGCFGRQKPAAQKALVVSQRPPPVAQGPLI